MNKKLSLVFAGVFMAAVSLPATAMEDDYHMLGGAENHHGYVGDSLEMQAIIGSPMEDGQGVMDDDHMMYDGNASMPSSPWDAAPVTHQQNDRMHKMTIESEEF